VLVILGISDVQNTLKKYFEITKIKYSYKVFSKYKIKYSDKSILKIQNKIVFSKYFSK